MSDKSMSDKYDALRDSKRVEILCQVRYGVDTPLEHEGDVTDLSDSGLRIETSELFDKGTKLRMEVNHLGTRYIAEGVVMWSVNSTGESGASNRHGMGVRFTKVDEALKRLYWER